MDLLKAVKLFDELGSKISDHRDYLAGNETVTRVLLVDPVLEVLGWDVKNPHIVELEFEPATSKRNKADYVLKNDGQNVAIVEVKRFNNPIDDLIHREQAEDYARYAGVKFFVLTDGAKWRLYERDLMTGLEDLKPIVQFNLANDDLTRCALKALCMWRDNLGSDSGPVSANEPIFVSQGIENPPPTKDGSQELITANTVTEVGLDGDWRDIRQRNLGVKDTKPTALKIQSDVIDPCPQDWNSVLAKVADWLIDEGRFIPSAGYRKKPNNKRYLIHDEAVHEDGLKFRAAKKLANNMFIETHGGAPQCVNQCVYLLKKYGDGVSVEVKFR